MELTDTGLTTRDPLDVTATGLAHGGHHDPVWAPSVRSAFSSLAQTLPGFRA